MDTETKLPSSDANRPDWSLLYRYSWAQPFSSFTALA